MNGDPSEETRPLLALLPALGLAAAGLVVLAMLSCKAPERAEQVALVFVPGTALADAVSTLEHEGGRIVRLGAFSNIVLADFGRERRVADLELAGVLLVLDPLVVGGCGFIDEVAGPFAGGVVTPARPRRTTSAELSG